jgi:hypothetical protein
LVPTRLKKRPKSRNNTKRSGYPIKLHISDMPDHKTDATPWHAQKSEGGGSIKNEAGASIVAVGR